MSNRQQTIIWTNDSLISLVYLCISVSLCLIELIPTISSLNGQAVFTYFISGQSVVRKMFAFCLGFDLIIIVSDFQNEWWCTSNFTTGNDIAPCWHWVQCRRGGVVPHWGAAAHTILWDISAGENWRKCGGKCIVLNLLALGKYGNYFESVNFIIFQSEFLSTPYEWLPDAWHRTPLMISQHWFR